MKKSKSFEKLITEIKELLYSNTDAVITWNDSMVDPDNPSQTRQIDISIKENGFVTHVECRMHDSRQDVKWIEELYGRKLSLQIDTMIAVSAMGFTQGAILKAQKFGIQLRDMKYLEKEDVKSWGKKMTAVVNYINFQKAILNFVFEYIPVINPKKFLVSQDIQKFLTENDIVLIDIFSQAKFDLSNINKNELLDVEFDYVIKNPLFIKGAKLIRIDIRLINVVQISKIHTVSKIALYGILHVNILPNIKKFTNINLL